MTSLNSQSTGSGAIPNALSNRSVTPGIAATAGSNGALSTAVTSAPSEASTQVQPPGEAPRSTQLSPAAGHRPNRTSASHNFRYARLGGPIWSSTKWHSPLTKGLDLTGLASSRSGASNVHAPKCDPGADAGNTSGL